MTGYYYRRLQTHPLKTFACLSACSSWKTFLRHIYLLEEWMPQFHNHGLQERNRTNLTLLQSFLLHRRSCNCRKEGRHFHTLCSHVVNPISYWSNWRQNPLCTVDLQYDKPLNYKVLDIMNDNILCPSYSKTYGKEP